MTAFVQQTWTGCIQTRKAAQPFSAFLFFFCTKGKAFLIVSCLILTACKNCAVLDYLHRVEAVSNFRRM